MCAKKTKKDDLIIITSNRGKYAHCKIQKNSKGEITYVVIKSNYSPSYLRRKIRQQMIQAKEAFRVSFKIADYETGTEIWTKTSAPDNGEGNEVTLPAGTRNYWNDVLQCGGRRLNFAAEVIYDGIQSDRCKPDIQFSDYKVYHVI